MKWTSVLIAVNVIMVMLGGVGVIARPSPGSVGGKSPVTGSAAGGEGAEPGAPGRGQGGGGGGGGSRDRDTRDRDREARRNARSGRRMRMLHKMLKRLTPEDMMALSASTRSKKDRSANAVSYEYGQYMTGAAPSVSQNSIIMQDQPPFEVGKWALPFHFWPAIHAEMSIQKTLVVTEQNVKSYNPKPAARKIKNWVWASGLLLGSCIRNLMEFCFSSEIKNKK